MAPVRTLRTTFSHLSALGLRFARSNALSARLPDFNFSLWQVKQYLLKTARRSSAPDAGDAAAEAADVSCGGDPAGTLCWGVAYNRYAAVTRKTAAPRTAAS